MPMADLYILQSEEQYFDDKELTAQPILDVQICKPYKHVAWDPDPISLMLLYMPL